VRDKIDFDGLQQLTAFVAELLGPAQNHVRAVTN